MCIEHAAKNILKGAHVRSDVMEIKPSDDDIRADLGKVQSKLTGLEVETVTALFSRVKALENLTRDQVARLWREFSRELHAGWLKLSDGRIRAFSSWVTSSPATREDVK